VSMKSESASTEVRRLKDCIGDLLSVSAIQAISRGSEPGHIIGALLEVLVGTLRLHLAYAEFKATGTGIPIALARFSQLPKSNDLPAAFREPVGEWLADKTQTSPFIIRCRSRDGDLSLALVSLGLRTEIGWLLVCSSREDFPTQTERLILGVAPPSRKLSRRDIPRASRGQATPARLGRFCRYRVPCGLPIIFHAKTLVARNPLILVAREGIESPTRRFFSLIPGSLGAYKSITYSVLPTPSQAHQGHNPGTPNLTELDTFLAQAETAGRSVVSSNSDTRMH
jgi:hypothetical protein